MELVLRILNFLYKAVIVSGYSKLVCLLILKRQALYPNYDTFSRQGKNNISAVTLRIH